MTAFTARVLAIVRAIPPGRVATYGDIAAFAGKPGAARAVGNIMRDCGDPSVPAHRVTAANGQLGGFGGSPHVKRERLAAEGIRFRGSRLREFKEIRWDGPARRRPRKAVRSRGTRS